MATDEGIRGERIGISNQNKSSLTSPEKVREILNEGVSAVDSDCNSKQGDTNNLEVKSNALAPCETTNHEAFFSRVESYSCMKWAAKPHILSPLMCARYGWVNVGNDMLKCSSCQAFLCASLQPSLDFEKYKTRVAEISTQLQTQHEKYCPWPDFPCPERFWLVSSSEPSALLTALLERFQSTCILAQQLPAISPELLKSMSLTEDVISIVLQLMEEEQKRKGGTPCSEPLAVQVSACIVSLCGWGANPSLHSMSLPTLSCSYCMRKVGLWNFHQIEGAAGDTETPPNSAGPSGSTAGHAPAATDGDVFGSASPAPTPTTPCRMKLRSQDSTRTDQDEGTPSPVALRARSRDSPSPSEELPSPLSRGKRPATRNRGQGFGSGTDGTAPLHPPKRLCLSSAGGPGGPLPKRAFDPLTQHRDWCPWISEGKENMDPEVASPVVTTSTVNQQAWKAALGLLMPTKKNANAQGGTPAQGPRDKTKGVFAILRQWQVSSSPQNV